MSHFSFPLRSSCLNFLSLSNSLSLSVAERTCLDVHFKGCRKLRLKSSKKVTSGSSGGKERRERGTRINQRELRGLHRADSWPAEAKSPHTKKHTHTHKCAHKHTHTWKASKEQCCALHIWKKILLQPPWTNFKSLTTITRYKRDLQERLQAWWWVMDSLISLFILVFLDLTSRSLAPFSFFL